MIETSLPGGHSRASPHELPEPTATRRPGRRARLLFAAKLAVTLGVLAFLLRQADWRLLVERLVHASPELLALGFAVKALTIPFAAERWRMIGRSIGMHLSACLSLRLVMAALFLGQVLPGALGGDVVRGWLTWRNGSHPPGTVVSALVLDRLAALVAVALLILLGLPRLLDKVPSGAVAGVLAVSALAGLVLVLLAWNGSAPFLRLGCLDAVSRTLAHVRTSVTGLRGAAPLRALAGALAHSVAVHLSTIAATVLFAQALSVPIRPLDALAVMPFAIAVMALPISLAGWGLRESSMVAGFALFGVANDDAFLIALLLGVSVTLLALPGGLAWLSLSGKARLR